eukprot:TRINITY_DN1657_c0_g1_i3.p1 TRINITY_DN1657_c0_g1~~TRINITY_DN1657_c0_g1_i3.p1  ORF type:complete len:446 (+),score=79.74 TRINITY_DN1657_c0_g1_i3:3-1340(+)
MCIRDRYQRRVHGGKNFLRKMFMRQFLPLKHITSLKKLVTAKSLRMFSLKQNKPYREEDQVITTKLDFDSQFKTIPTFRVIDLQGNVIAKEYDNLDPKILKRIYKKMVQLEEMDTILLQAQRQGRISFYMPCFGESACVIGSAAALNDYDLIYPQYREQGALLWRGMTTDEFTSQCASNGRDPAKGRQMPVHYTSSKLNFVCVSSPLTTQVPQASGAGYSFKLKQQDRVAVTFFGEGASSEGDFHTGMNFAMTLGSQTLFLCRNNKYAISTPSDEQFKGDGVAGKSKGYGMLTIRCDGNDALAVYQAVKYARQYIIKKKEPAFIEFMTYRVGDHSTSDHSILYREEEELKSWTQINNPIIRLGLYLKKKGIMQIDEESDKELRKKYRSDVIKSLKAAIEEKKPGISQLFLDVYDRQTLNLNSQRQSLEDHLEKYKDKYNLENFEK